MNNSILYKDNVFFYQHNPFNTLIIIQSKKKEKEEKKNFLYDYWLTDLPTDTHLQYQTSLSVMVIHSNHHFFFNLLMTATTK